MRSRKLSLSLVGCVSLVLSLSGLSVGVSAVSSNARPGGSSASSLPQLALANGGPLFQAQSGLGADGPSPAQPLVASNQHHPKQQQQPQQSPAEPSGGQAASLLASSLAAARVDAGSSADNLISKQSPIQSLAAQPAILGHQQTIAAKYGNMETECVASGGFISFELITGYVLSAPADMMLMQPGTIQLTECLNICRQNSSCLAINFETGLCVLLQESADRNPQALQKSQFPVFTIYAHKICLQGDRANRCHKSWSFERVIGWVLNNMEKKTLLTKTRLECLLACYNEQSFQCKSFNYDSASGSCQLSDVDRHSLASAAARRRHFVESSVDTVDYGENNCVQEVRGICDFKPLQNRILKTVDSIYQDVKSEAECRKRCLQSAYRCHSYDLGDSSNPVCRTSHLDRNSLQQIQDPYLDIQGAVSYELDSCYNVTVSCKSREMVARVKTNKIFNGKIYAKNSPLSCVNDITNSMDFELSMAFNDACSINRNSNSGLFANEIVIQHNDMVVTNSDIGLNLRCQYDLRNQTVYNNINLDDFMTGREPIDVASQSALVRSPNISMQILRHDGNHIQQAQVGDPLMLRFQITDQRSPFEIFVRDLYAMDGVGGTEIMLIDGEGCPTDPSIMAAMSNAKGNGQTLEAQFDAFKFPTSERVAFRALVTPCIPHCQPVHCQNRGLDGVLYEAESLGKRRRRRRRSVEPAKPATLVSGSSKSPQSPEEVVVRNSIEIRDRFFNDDQPAKSTHSSRTLGYDFDHSTTLELDGSASWLNAANIKFGSLTFVFCALIVAQSALIAGLAMIWKRRLSKSAPAWTDTSSNQSQRIHM